jgi:GrpB-like predicted nucleotidyltransferase (UPF0157 family)
MGSTARSRAALKDLAAAGGVDMPVKIVAYDPSWPASFEVERSRVAPLLEGAKIHHVGSTAVPGLASKPIIDMVAVVDSYAPAVSRLVIEGGYQYPRGFNATLSRERFLCYPTPRRRTHHMHLVDDPAELDRYLRFRDRLRAHPALAREYEALKRQLADHHPQDREAYTQAKTEFVRRHRV